MIKENEVEVLLVDELDTYITAYRAMTDGTKTHGCIERDSEVLTICGQAVGSKEKVDNQKSFGSVNGWKVSKNSNSNILVVECKRCQKKIDRFEERVELQKLVNKRHWMLRDLKNCMRRLTDLNSSNKTVLGKSVWLLSRIDALEVAITILNVNPKIGDVSYVLSSMVEELRSEEEMLDDKIGAYQLITYELTAKSNEAQDRLQEFDKLHSQYDFG